MRSCENQCGRPPIHLYCCAFCLETDAKEHTTGCDERATKMGIKVKRGKHERPPTGMADHPGPRLPLPGVGRG